VSVILTAQVKQDPCYSCEWFFSITETKIPLNWQNKTKNNNTYNIYTYSLYPHQIKLAREKGEKRYKTLKNNNQKEVIIREVMSFFPLISLIYQHNQLYSTNHKINIS